MAPQEDGEATRRRALDLLHQARWPVGGEVEADVRRLLPELRTLREFELLAQLSERILRAHPDETVVRRLHVQALIETGYASAAIEVARAGLKGLPQSHPEWSELTGLIGRGYKQMVVDAHDPGGREVQRALRLSLEAYAKPYRHDPGNTWHAVNLVALLDYAQRVGVKAPKGLRSASLAQQIIATLEAKPADRRDRWDAATLAEAHLALGNLDAVERHLSDYLRDQRVGAFDVASTLRQFSEVWGLKDHTDARRQGLLQAMRARLMELPNAQLRLTPGEIVRERGQASPTVEQLQAILGDTGTKSYDWWKLGLERACSVAALYAGVGQRLGTGFLVSGKDLGRADTADEVLLLTNFHVVNKDGAGGALRPEDAEIAFEAVDPNQRYQIQKLVWQSSVEEYDACLLQRKESLRQVAPVPVNLNLPVVEATARVYVIGHPGGGALEFSFQDNALLDHEGPPDGKPSNQKICRLHYRTPTEKGSSGSPVFNAGRWQAIALHHAGGVLSRLNGKPGTYQANEGIALKSIKDALASKAS